jgi:cytochrome oxidase Cu insertion factor (SCO1/SenC/PrrC family)
MSDPTPASPTSPGRFPAFWFLIIGVSILAIGGSLFLKSSLSRFELSRQPALPILKQLRASFTAAERLGQDQDLASLKGKAVVLAYTYTRCPHGCAGVAAQMLKVRDAFSGNPQVHLVSVAVWPEVDTPAMLNAFAKSLGVQDSDPWWWLSTNRTAAWDYLTREVGFGPCREIPADERLNPEDYVEHDLRAVLIDPQQRVRAFYSLMHPQTEVAQMALDKLLRDITTVLKE